jgi:hypothetical protein
MTTPKIRFSSHVQLQYLKAKNKIDDSKLTIEMAQYYSHEAFELKRTKYGKITAVSLRDGHRAPKLRAALPRPKQRSQTKKQPRTPKPFKQERYIQSAIQHPASYQSQIGVPVVVKKRRVIR